eukprot:749210-Hanusia_phi.AAC.1
MATGDSWASAVTRSLYTDDRNRNAWVRLLSPPPPPPPPPPFFPLSHSLKARCYTLLTLSPSTWSVRRRLTRMRRRKRRIGG